MHVHVGALLFGHRRHALGLAAIGRVVVAQVQLGGVGQAQHLVDGLVQGLGAATGEVAAGGAVVGHEQGVTHKGHLAHRVHAVVGEQVGHAGGGMARGVQGAHFQAAQHEGVAVGQQSVKLAAVASKFGAGIEQLAKLVLHRGDVRADGQLAAEIFLQVGRRRQVVGMHMGFQQPLHLQAQFVHAVHQAVGTLGVGAAALGVVVQHAVDQGALRRGRIPGDVAEGEGGRVEEGFDVQAGRGGHGGLLR